MIWLIQIKSKNRDRWIAINQPCYSLLDAREKLKRYRSQCPSSAYRIAQYVEHTIYDAAPEAQ